MKIYCEPYRHVISISLVVRLVDQDNGIHKATEIEKLQRRALEELGLQNQVNTYVYPRETLHFTPLNITTFEIESDFESSRRSIEQQSWYDKFLSTVAPEILSDLTNHFADKEFYLEKFYLDQESKIRGSLALNLLCNDDSEVFAELGESIRKKVVLQLPLNNFGLKRPENHFVMNILRFINDQSVSMTDCDQFYNFVLQENKTMSENRDDIFLKNIKPVCVVADWYLSNTDPVIVKI